VVSGKRFSHSFHNCRFINRHIGIADHLVSYPRSLVLVWKGYGGN